MEAERLKLSNEGTDGVAVETNGGTVAVVFCVVVVMSPSMETFLLLSIAKN